MDVKAAAAACRESIDKCNAPEKNREFGKDHLHNMINKIESGEVSGDKAHRWFADSCR